MGSERLVQLRFLVACLALPLLAAVGKVHAGPEAEDAFQQVAAIPANEERMEPIRVPGQDTHPEEPASPLRVEDILRLREGTDVPPAHEEFPLVPGCEPVAGDTAALPPVDLAHHLGSRGVCLPAQWVDSFFADEEADFFAARTLVRVIGTSRFQESSQRSDDLRLDARFVLPHTDERLSLILRSDDQDDDRLSERDNIREEEEEGEEGVFRAALRWGAYQTRRATGQLDTGVRARRPFVRARYRYRQPLPLEAQARVNQEFYWRGTEERRGAATELRLERSLTRRTMLRFTSAGETNTRLRNENLDWRWSQSASWFWRISKRSAMRATLRLQGHSEPSFRTESRRVSVRFRRSFWRPWLYYEVEPYAFALREDDFAPVPGVVFRLETQWGDYR